MERTQTCPRRMNEIGPWERDTNQDSWRPDDRLGVEGETACSFCGSLHPEMFLELVAKGWLVGPTDKTYKAYLDKPATDEQRVAKKEQWLAGRMAQAIRRSAEAEGKAPHQVSAELDRVYTVSHPMADSAGRVAKFYYQHFNESQMQRFVDLYNDNTMRISTPGYFYRLPFFMATGAA